MRVLIVIPSLRKGGAERLVVDTARELMKLDSISFRLVIFRDIIEYDVSDLKDNIKVIPALATASVFRRGTVSIDELQKFIVEFSPAVIHTHLYEADFVTRMCTYPTARWFSHGHNYYPVFNTRCSFGKLRKVFATLFERYVFLHRCSVNGGNSLIAITESVRNYYLKKTPGFKVHLLPNAIDVSKFSRPITVSGPRIGRKLKLISVGSFKPAKNQQFLLRLVKEMSKLHDVELLILGDGAEKKRLHDLCSELEISSRVQFVGNVSNVENYYWESTLFVHSALIEPFGLVLIEAMAAGLPVVSLNGGGNKELVLNGFNGYLVEANEDISVFSSKILEVTKDSETFERFSSNAIEFASKFDIHQYCRKLVEIYYSNGVPKDKESRLSGSN